MAVLSKFALAFDDYASPIEVNVVIQNDEYEDDLLSIDSLEEKTLDVIPKVEKKETLTSFKSLLKKKKSSTVVEKEELFIVRNEMVLNGLEGIETPLDIYRCQLLEHILGSGAAPVYEKPTCVATPGRSLFNKLKKRISKAFRFR